MGKPIWQSKTLWVNLIALIAAVLTAYGINVDAETQGALVGGVMAAVNLVLRVMTHRPIKGGPHA